MSRQRKYQGSRFTSYREDSPYEESYGGYDNDSRSHYRPERHFKKENGLYKPPRRFDNVNSPRSFKPRPFTGYSNHNTSKFTQNSVPDQTRASTDSIGPLISTSSKSKTDNVGTDKFLPQWNTRIDPEILDECKNFDSEGKLRPNSDASQSSKPTIKAVYDPELSRDKSKGKSIIYRKEIEPKATKDPRKESNFKNYLQNTKRLNKIPFKSLAPSPFNYDKHSMGPPPPTEIILRGLENDFENSYIINQLKKIGSIEEQEAIHDPLTGVPLGLLRVKFGDGIDKASKACLSAIKELHQTKVRSNIISVILKKNDEHLKQIITKEIGTKITKIKLAGIEEKKTVLPSAPKAVLRKIAKHTAEYEAQKTRVTDKAITRKSNEPMQSSNNSIEEGGIKVPDELGKYIKGRSFIFIASRYIKNKLSKSDIKKALETYDWSRVLDYDHGIFIVFNSPREAQRCFNSEDGKPIFSVNIYMKLQLPEGYKPTKEDDAYVSEERNILDEATSLLTKELEDALLKDIRTKVIAPAILDFLNIDNFPELKEKIQPKPSATIEKNPEPESLVDMASVVERTDIFSLGGSMSKLPVFKKKSVGEKLTDKTFPQKKRRLLPMNYRMNFEDEEDKKHPISKIERSNHLGEPLRKKLKKSSTTPEKFVEEKKERGKDKDEDEDEDIDMEEKEEKTEPLEDDSYPSSSEDEEEPLIEIKESLPTTPEDAKMDVDVQEEVAQHDIDHSIFDLLHQPVTSEFPIPVYEEEADDLLLDLEGFQKIIKDEEDFELLKELLIDEKPTELEYPVDYWCWKSKTLKAERAKNVQDSAIIIPSHLENSTGSYRSQGYAKISDEVKIDYLPHRKRVHDPLSTIQVDNEDAESSKVQSSRANRSNNRRFAYEVSNFNADNEILTMNQLNKRKKPVSFARSAIHNWGLYALEPIAGREMIIEYVGERIRQQVADFREKSYLKSGIGSSYLFRVDENTVIDATKKGGIARFINHSCVPSCTAKIIKVEGQKRIVIYALRDIGTNEELTYDYKFERETNDNERVRCLCGAPGCKGYLN